MMRPKLPIHTTEYASTHDSYARLPVASSRGSQCPAGAPGARRCRKKRPARRAPIVAKMSACSGGGILEAGASGRGAAREKRAKEASICARQRL